MPKRSPNVAKLPADLDRLELPRQGIRWLRDPLTGPLRMRLSIRGKTWVYHGRVKGKPRRVVLGRYPRMSLDAARTAAMRVNDAGAVGTPITVGQLLAQYLDGAKFKSLAQRTQQSYRAVLQGRWYTALMTRKLREVTRQDLLGIRDAVARDGLVYSNVMRPSLALFGYALDEGLINANPATRLKLPRNEADPHPFTEEEMGAMMRGLEKTAEPYRTLGILVALTGSRPTTLCSARWSEINTQTGTFTVSRSRGRKSKLGRGWSVPLCERAVDLLKALKKSQGRNENEFVFGRALVVEQKARDRIAKAAGMSGEKNRGSLHRFRSTMASKLTEWSVPVETQQRLMGHASPMIGARGFYVVPTPTEAEREVIERYADWIKFCQLL